MPTISQNKNGNVSNTKPRTKINLFLLTSAYMTTNEANRIIMGRCELCMMVAPKIIAPYKTPLNLSAAGFVRKSIIVSNKMPLNTSGINSDTVQDTQVNAVRVARIIIASLKPGNVPSIARINLINKKVTISACAKSVYQNEVRSEECLINIP